MNAPFELKSRAERKGTQAHRKNEEETSRNNKKNQYKILKTSNIRNLKAYFVKKIISISRVNKNGKKELQYTIPYTI